MDAEQMMVEALRGKFFWTPGHGPGDGYNEDGIAIRIAQEKFRDPIVEEYAYNEEEELEKIRVRTEGVEKAVIMAKSLGGVYNNAFELLKEAVASCYGVDADRIVPATNNKRLCEAKHHYYWAMVRYFPKLSVAEIGRQLGRHHSVIIHSRNKFEAKKADYLAEIEIIDKAMGCVICGR